jgi:hypothetical protein
MLIQLREQRTELPANSSKVVVLSWRVARVSDNMFRNRSPSAHLNAVELAKEPGLLDRLHDALNV